MTDLFQHRLHSAVEAARPLVSGRVTGAVGLRVTVSGLEANVGDLLRLGVGEDIVLAEVAALDGERLSCMPLGPITGIGAGTPAVSTGGPLRVAVGPDLRGRILDGLGRPMDGGPPLRGHLVPIDSAPPSAMERQLVDAPMSLGVRVLDTLVPCGRGQRIGIFAGSGVGKSTLMSMITRGTSAELNVVALVGERGREVREFIEHDLGPEGLARSVLVIATSDTPPLVRLRAGAVATRIAEYYRDDGADVLLMMDSVTRAAMAQREVGLSVGEPPATRGYPPSVFAMLASLLERAGPGARGSITGLYTVLVEGDDHNEPIADAARSILDGHIVLDRKLATAGHFPAIQALDSISRVANRITTPQQRSDATELRRLMAAHRDVRELVEIGAYVPGTNPDADRANAAWPQIGAFLRQGLDDRTTAESAWAELRALIATT
ncbi:flagellum-specific ATP synthase [Actinoplanes campanulatus]|uniref:Flagellum-specific ATP synthase n=1 Tax=Actinoplanes campanulatus TaxID=113559 RepID=A0A7W5AIS2_9ACTN|nr:FliI/YscN family ATPase [Actinoplanes campanulatus]MBB3097063.1 flagellum-specific ATP synthase [Actinoplanes campanulatus]GGN15405.1 EscN/YscN/HrcN family type III secretion system ATPase [Actinoplanes campanulatus]GID37756.1 EscN/YscN/HrcN family type III secretion system ATPase [Actinoplanes campanulatus]